MSSVPGWLPSISPSTAALLPDAGQADWLVGGDASSRLSLAGALAARAPRAAFARMAGCRGVNDALLLIGEAVGAPVPGSAVSLGETLRQRAPLLIVLDDADTPHAEAAVAQLEALAPDVRWLRLAPSLPEPLPDRILTLPEPPAPLPMLNTALAERALGLALLPAGLPVRLPLPLSALHPTRPGRQALRRALSESLQAQHRAEPSRVAEALLSSFEAVLSLAEGAPLRAGVCVEDLLAVRWMGEVLADPEAAARATAAAGRLLTIWGQPGAARGLLNQGLRRETRAGAAARALLRWAEADAMLSSGAVGVARDRFEEAERLLQESRELELLATLTRRRADALAARSLSVDAGKAYQRARDLYRRLDDTDGVMATLRGTADLAISQGELIAADALYDQITDAPVPALEDANRRLGQATLSLSHGSNRDAERLLTAAIEEAEDVPVLEANLARRRADLALRQRDFAEAQRLCEAAIAAYARAGERAAVGHAIRLLGDIAAGNGQLVEAATHYQRAIATQIEVGDILALRRTLHHAIVLEESSGDRTYAQRLRTFFDALNP